MAQAPKKDDLRKRFEAAAAAAKQTKKRPDNPTLLKLYSLYKQATEGDVRGERPGGFDFVGGAKHDAWTKLKGMSADDAMTQYIKQVDRLAARVDALAEAVNQLTRASGGKPLRESSSAGKTTKRRARTAKKVARAPAG